MAPGIVMVNGAQEGAAIVANEMAMGVQAVPAGSAIALTRLRASVFGTLSP